MDSGDSKDTDGCQWRFFDMRFSVFEIDRGIEVKNNSGGGETC